LSIGADTPGYLNWREPRNFYPFIRIIRAITGDYLTVLGIGDLDPLVQITGTIAVGYHTIWGA
jgi:hypothetical protein